MVMAAVAVNILLTMLLSTHQCFERRAVGRSDPIKHVFLGAIKMTACSMIWQLAEFVLSKSTKHEARRLLMVIL